MHYKYTPSTKNTHCLKKYLSFSCSTFFIYIFCFCDSHWQFFYWEMLCYEHNRRAMVQKCLGKLVLTSSYWAQKVSVTSFTLQLLGTLIHTSYSLTNWADWQPVTAVACSLAEHRCNALFPAPIQNSSVGRCPNSGHNPLLSLDCPSCFQFESLLIIFREVQQHFNMIYFEPWTEKCQSSFSQSSLSLDSKSVLVSPLSMLLGITWSLL